MATKPKSATAKPVEKDETEETVEFLDLAGVMKLRPKQIAHIIRVSIKDSIWDFFEGGEIVKLDNLGKKDRIKEVKRRLRLAKKWERVTLELLNEAHGMVLDDEKMLAKAVAE